MNKDVMIINKDEYDMLVASATSSNRLENENAELKKRIMDIESRGSFNGKMTIDFQTTLICRNVFDLWIKEHNVIDSMQVDVANDNCLAGYEHEIIFDKLSKLAESMKYQICEKYDDVIKDAADQIDELNDRYDKLRDKVDSFNKKHLFKVKI